MGLEDGSKLRVDTTVVATDIHHPTDLLVASHQFPRGRRKDRQQGDVSYAPVSNRGLEKP